MPRVAGNGLTFAALEGAAAIFADRTASPPGDHHALAVAASHALSLGLGELPAVLFPRQRHTRLVFAFRGTIPVRGTGHEVGVCDALITDQPGVALMVVTADCLPVALAGGGCVAMVHAGWRGLAADILGAVTAQLRAEYGVDPSELRAAIGVGVGPCHYRVGDDVREGLARHGVGDAAWRVGECADLAAWARGRLVTLGVVGERIATLSGCTACSPRHHSYRRDGQGAGRQWSAVAVTPRSPR